MTYAMASKVRKRRVAQLISGGKRLDGRGLTDYREVQV